MKLDEMKQLCDEFENKLKFNESQQQNKIEQLNTTIDDLKMFVYFYLYKGEMLFLFKFV